MLSYEKARTAAEFHSGYDNGITPAIVAKWDAYFKAKSLAAIASSPNRHRLVYGTMERNCIDFFPSATLGAPAPLLIAIHGGLWFLFDKWFMHFLAPAFNAAGVHVASINYPLAPQASLDRIVTSCLSAVGHLSAHAHELLVLPDKISVLGHSAAGQLAAVTATAKRESIAGTNTYAYTTIKSWIGVSGFYDIEPFAQSGFQPIVEFTDADYRRWNPPSLVREGLPSALLITGGRESDLLHDMMTGYAQLYRRTGNSARELDATGECHFSVLARIGEADSELHRTVLDFLLM